MHMLLDYAGDVHDHKTHARQGWWVPYLVCHWRAFGMLRIKRSA